MLFVAAAKEVIAVCLGFFIIGTVEFCCSHNQPFWFLSRFGAADWGILVSRDFLSGQCVQLGFGHIG